MLMHVQSLLFITFCSILHNFLRKIVKPKILTSQELFFMECCCSRQKLIGERAMHQIFGTYFELVFLTHINICKD